MIDILSQTKFNQEMLSKKVVELEDQLFDKRNKNNEYLS